MIATWRYHLPSIKGEGWAIIFMDSQGSFAALSDWGNVSNRWPDESDERDFRDFIIGCDDDYLRRKFGHQFGQNREEYDGEATLASLKQYILRARRDGSWSKEEAADEWELLEHYQQLETEIDFSNWYQSSGTTIGDAYEFVHRRFDNGVTNFVAKAMPRLREVLRAELEREHGAEARAP
jgi:hypothetical protein